MIEVSCKRCGVPSGDLDPRSASHWEEEGDLFCNPEATVARVLDLLDDTYAPDEVVSPIEATGYWKAIAMVRKAVRDEEDR